MKENLDWRARSAARPAARERSSRAHPFQPPGDHTNSRAILRRPLAHRRYNFTEFNKAVFTLNVLTLALMLSAQSYFWRASNLWRPAPAARLAPPSPLSAPLIFPSLALFLSSPPVRPGSERSGSSST